MPTVRANGIDIYYDQRGEGDDLVLIMGLGAHAGAWVLNAPAFATRFRVTTFDNRGAGRTSAPDEPYSIRQMADDTAALLGELGIRRAHVVGASMGGMVAQELAINYPEVVNRLVIACSRARTSPLRKLVSVAQRALWEAGIPREAIAAIQQPWGSTSAILQDERKPLERLELAAKDPHPIQKHAYLRQLDATMAHDAYDRLVSVAAPTLVLVGAEDILTPPHENEEIARQIPGAQLRILPRGGHGFSAEYPDEFNRAVLEFLGAAPAAK
jgi:pimeloyl-ACP methyl ester carboxylesterase